MTFLRTNWGQLSCSGSQPVQSLQDGTLSGCPSHFSYISNTDSLATISVSGYFNSVKYELGIGDCLHAVGADLAQMFQVSAVFPTVTLIPMTGGGGQPFNWQYAIANTPMAVNNGYISDGAGRVTLTLPPVAMIGDTIRVTNLGNGFTIAQNGGQQIIAGNDSTTIGVGGSLASTALGDSLEMVCVFPNITFMVQHSIGNITVV